jgi:hypothetical protein
MHNICIKFPNVINKYKCPSKTACYTFKQQNENVNVYHQLFLYIIYKNKPRYLVLKTRSNATIKMTISWTEDSVLLPKSVKENREISLKPY